MSAKRRLMDALFTNGERKHLNLKFFRGPGNNVSEEDLCNEAASAIFQVDSGIVEGRRSFGDANLRQLPIANIINAA